MTITTDPGRWTFTASGATGTFSVPKPAFDESAIALYAVDQATNVIYVPTYTVTLAADRSGCTIDVTAGMTSGDKVVAYRVPYRTQAQPLSASGPLPPKIVERQLDRAFADTSALYEMVRRSARFPLADDTPALELPIASQRASKLLGFDAAGAWSVIAGIASVPVSSAWAAVVQAASIAAGLTQAGFSIFFQTLIGAADDAALRALADLVAPAAPVGRLTLATGVPVMTSDQTGKTVVYWTPHGGVGRAPVWDGTRFATISFGEVSNDLTSAAANVGPAAAQPYSCYDLFLTATGHLVRGPRWRKAQTFTVTSATPAVFTTGADHGFYDGQVIYLETTGALYTGLAVLTAYFVTVVSSTTFKVSTTLANQVAGTFVATSGSQSGVHTVATFTQERGTGTGTSELELLSGLYVNKNAITNGPAARLGTYVGTCLTDGSSQVNWHRGGVGAGGTEAKLHLWNAYNRVAVEGFIGPSDNTWNYTTDAFRPVLGSATMRVSAVMGLRIEPLSMETSGYFSNATNNAYCRMGVGFNAMTPAANSRIPVGHAIYATLVSDGLVAYHAQAFLGAGYLVPLEASQASGTTTWFGDNGGAPAMQSGANFRGAF